MTFSLVVNVLAVLADVWILSTYFVMSRNPSRVRWFHWANGIGSLPLIVVEVMTKAFTVMPITTCFGILGWYGLWQGGWIVPERRLRGSHKSTEGSA